MNCQYKGVELTKEEQLRYEIERLRGGLQLIADDTHRLMNEVARQTAASILSGKPIGATDQPSASLPRAEAEKRAAELMQMGRNTIDAARYRWLRDRINFRDQFVRSEDGKGLSTKWRAWVHDDYRENPPASEHIDEYIDGQLGAAVPTDVTP